MAKSAVQKHVHKVKRLRFKSGNSMYFCTLPDCYFKLNPALILGKKVICWRCGEEFIMNEYSVRLARPHCERCHKTKEIRMSSELEEMFVNAPLIQEEKAALSLAEKFANTIKSKLASNAVASEGDEDI